MESHPSALNRREALARAIALVASAGVIANTGCASGAEAFGPRELRVLEEFCETVIPQTDTPGARAAGVHGFIVDMMRDWAAPQTRAAFRQVLGRLDEAAEGRFAILDPAARLALVRRIDAEAYARGDETWARLKELVLLGYYTSEIGATQELRYVSVPSEWRPCERMAPEARAWAT